MRASDPIDPLLPPEFPAGLRAACRVRAVSQGERIFRAGAAADAVFRMIEGEAQLLRAGPDGSEIVLQRARPGEYFAEASLFSDRYHCDARCAASGRLLVLPAEALRRALAREPAFATAWVHTLSRALRDARARCERLSLKRAGDRIVHFLANTSGKEIELGQPLNAWARELGLTQEALYRALARLERAGILARRGRRLRLRGPRR